MPAPRPPSPATDDTFEQTVTGPPRQPGVPAVRARCTRITGGGQPPADPRLPPGDRLLPPQVNISAAEVRAPAPRTPAPIQITVGPPTGTHLLTSHGARAGNLPPELTGFMRRRQDISEARELLSRTRILTLTGPGGVGKTRLAVRTASKVSRSYPDGVWLARRAHLGRGEAPVVDDMADQKVVRSVVRPLQRPRSGCRTRGRQVELRTRLFLQATGRVLQIECSVSGRSDGEARFIKLGFEELEPIRQRLKAQVAVVPWTDGDLEVIRSTVRLSGCRSKRGGGDRQTGHKCGHFSDGRRQRKAASTHCGHSPFPRSMGEGAVSASTVNNCGTLTSSLVSRNTVELRHSRAPAWNYLSSTLPRKFAAGPSWLSLAHPSGR